jgi:FkbM family methyltransferase
MSFSTFLKTSLRNPAYAPRRLAWEFVTRGQPRDVTRHTRHGLFTFHSRDRSIGRNLFINREFDLKFVEETIALLVRIGLLKASGNPLLLDIGGNIGTVCVPLVARNVFKSAWAFEPDPTNLRLLRQNIGQNRLENRIQVHSCALSNEEGECELLLSNENYGDHRLRTGNDPGGSGTHDQSVKVPLKTLDNVLSAAGVKPQEISLIWLDVQGHEPEVLEGASEVLSGGVPIVLEFWPEVLRKRGGPVVEGYLNRLKSHFSAFYDLSKPHESSRAVTSLDDLMKMGLTGNRNEYTDLLLLPTGRNHG